MAASDQVHFETPENIQVAYRVAGLGTRFIAWFLDTILLSLLAFALFLLLACSGVASEAVLRSLPDPEKVTPHDTARTFGYAIGLFILINGLGGFLYFIACELLLRGQTLGKRQMGLRVVKANGFSLDPMSIFVRNIFRVIDNLPVLWLVPLVTERSQRLGDLVAGTIVVFDQTQPMSSVREVLAGRPPQESKFRFDATALKQARAEDVEAVEKVLERLSSMELDQQEMFLQRLVEPLATRLKMELPAAGDRLQFLEDFLAAVYRRQHQMLG